MAKIKVENLTKIFGRNEKHGIKLLQEGSTKDDILKETGMTVGVNQCSFEVEEGEVFVIMGLSGSGKSTLIRLINRLIEPSHGNIYIDDMDLSNMDRNELRETRRSKLSMVFQSFALFPHRSILENTAFGLEVQEVEKSKREELALESLRLVG